ncbi:hypothetical protein CN417_01435 [Bacillus thuringiensis]|uniref:hypothetical protein n=1 Tax=Bacillus cereus group TaxID=86661 RepID=UPI000A3CD9E4|nr:MULTISPECIES: hypothetical protein [Bacillus cereus group]KAA1808164.1 hypothetical protein FXB61_001030 [Bacillus cereus]OUB17011.1 hypothetical protein BK708_23295 [Bacillus thuringiensis serovar yunnanensis]PEV14333.1 hypothetical protein CN417_01435 [Bacillus thuringiensis]
MIKREERATYDNTSFLSLLKENGIFSLTIGNLGFYVAILLGWLSYRVFINMKQTEITEIAGYISNILPGVSASILGIIIAGLSIIVALTSGKILHLLLKNKTLQNLLFPFWYAAALWGIIIVITMSFPIIIKITTMKILIYSIVFVLSLTIYTLFGTIALIGNTIRIMVILAQLNDN